MTPARKLTPKSGPPDGLDPAVDKDAAVVFVVDGISRHGVGDDVHLVAAAGQLRTLREGLTLGAAGERVEVAHDVADAKRRLRVVSHEMPGLRRLREPGSWTFRSFLKWG